MSGAGAPRRAGSPHGTIRIAYVNDYGVDPGTLSKCASGLYPKHHLWGMYDILSDHRFSVELIDNNYFSRIRNPKLNKVHSLVRWLWNQLRLVVRSRGCDILFGTQVCFSRMPISLPALLRHFGLCKARIVITLQNPQVRVPRFHKYDKLVFLSAEVMEAFLRHSPGLSGISEHVLWGPDLAFYDSLKANAPTDKVAEFISNGKTGRDPETFLAACEKAGASAVLVHNNAFVPSPARKANPKFRLVTGSGSGNVISDVENVELLLGCDVMVLPIRPSRPGLYGTTSFLDAIALGMPIVMSDNTMIGVDVEKLQFGLFYRAGDPDSLADKLRMLASNEELQARFRRNSRAFAEEHDLNAFTRRILGIFHSLLQTPPDDGPPPVMPG